MALGWCARAVYHDDPRNTEHAEQSGSHHRTRCIESEDHRSSTELFKICPITAGREGTRLDLAPLSVHPLISVATDNRRRIGPTAAHARARRK